MDKNIGTILKKSRINLGMSVEEVSSFLIKKGYKALEKTVYSWETGNSQPKPDVLLELCNLYGINDVLGTFGYAIPSSPVQTLAAHFDGDEFTDDELDEIQKYAEFIKSKRKKDGK